MSTIQSKTLLAALATTSCRVLETAAFAFADIAEEPGGYAFDQGFTATITMTGDLVGRLTIAASAELSQSLSADVVGMEPEEMSLRDASDMLGELANIIAGQLATDLLGETAVVHLNPPESGSLDLEQWNAMRERSGTVTLVIEGDQPMLLDLRLSNNW